VPHQNTKKTYQNEKKHCSPCHIATSFMGSASPSPGRPARCRFTGRDTRTRRVVVQNPQHSIRAKKEARRGFYRSKDLRKLYKSKSWATKSSVHQLRRNAGKYTIHHHLVKMQIVNGDQSPGRKLFYPQRRPDPALPHQPWVKKSHQL